MARHLFFAHAPLAGLLATLSLTACMHGLQAAIQDKVVADRVSPAGQTACKHDSTPFQSAMRELRGLGLALQAVCDHRQAQVGVRLLVLDSVRASEVLRGPLANGEPVDLKGGVSASPDVQFNVAWLEQVLQRHQVPVAGSGDGPSAGDVASPMDLAAR